MNISPVGKTFLKPDTSAGVPAGSQVISPAAELFHAQTQDAISTLWASDSTANRPKNPVKSQLFYDTTLNALLMCLTPATGPNSGDAVWVQLLSGNSMTAPLPGGRLTLTSGVPVTTADVIGATTIYYTPYKSNQVELWDGSYWRTVTFSEVAGPLAGVGGGFPCDVFLKLVAGVPQISLAQWGSNTTRTFPINLQDGRYVVAADKAQLYLGTFYTTAPNTTEDSGGGVSTAVGGKRFLWNMYNRVARRNAVFDTSAAWAYTTQVIRQADGAGGKNNCLECVIGVQEDAAQVQLSVGIQQVNGVTFWPMVGIGVNSVSAFSGTVGQLVNSGAAFLRATQIAIYENALPAGYNYVSWLEYGGDGTCFFVGTAQGTSSGMWMMHFA